MIVEPQDPRPPDDASPALRALTAAWGERLRATSGPPPRVALVEGTDPRVMEAACRLARDGLVQPLLVGDPAKLHRLAEDRGLPLPRDPDRPAVLDPAALASDACVTDTLKAALARRRGLTDPEREELCTDPLHLAVTALHLGDVDVCLAGSDRPTADVLRAGLRVIGLAPGVRTLSSSFLIVPPGSEEVLSYGDCAVVVDPEPAQLADIARATARTHQQLTGAQPRVALLSFSTLASASHARVDRVRQAVELLRTGDPFLLADGDLQYDAAADPLVGAAKAPGSPVAGRANTFVFPSLEAGNIGYKVAQRVGGAASLGPLLQGLAAPLHDLSRGCTASDVAALALAGGVQARAASPSSPPAPPAPPVKERS